MAGIEELEERVDQLRVDYQHAQDQADDLQSQADEWQREADEFEQQLAELEDELEDAREAEPSEHDEWRADDNRQRAADINATLRGGW